MDYLEQCHNMYCSTFRLHFMQMKHPLYIPAHKHLNLHMHRLEEPIQEHQRYVTVYPKHKIDIIPHRKRSAPTNRDNISPGIFMIFLSLILRMHTLYMAIPNVKFPFSNTVLHNTFLLMANHNNVPLQANTFVKYHGKCSNT